MKKNLTKLLLISIFFNLLIATHVNVFAQITPDNPQSMQVTAFVPPRVTDMQLELKNISNDNGMHKVNAFQQVHDTFFKFVAFNGCSVAIGI